MSIETRKIIGRAVLETLEHRQLMSSVSMVDGTLLVQGSPTTANHINVKTDGTDAWVVANGNTSDKIAVTNIKIIKIIGGEGKDFVAVDKTVTIPVYVQTGNGNDQISTGSGNDTIFAGNGDDHVYSGNGNDEIHGGNGNDTLAGGKGNDWIAGGNGGDHVDAGQGNDNVSTGSGDDVVEGNDGDDKINLGTGKDSANGGAGINIVAGQKSAHVLRATFVGDRSTPTPPPVSDPTPPTTPTDPTTPTTPTDPTTPTTPTDPTTPTTPTDPTTPVVPTPPTQPTDPSDKLAPTGTITVTSNSTIAADQSVQVTVVDPTDIALAKNTDWNSPDRDSASWDARYMAATNAGLKHGTVLTANFAWDFGDPGSQYNQLVGFNAAHNYTHAGKYTISLTITNDLGKTSVITKEVTVTASNRKVIYVSNDGSDDNSGLSPQSAVKSFSKAMGMIDDNTEVLFNRGDTFGVTNGAIIDAKNVVIGAYGTGSQPIVKWTGERKFTAIFGINGSSRDIAIENLTVDSKFTDKEKANMPDAISAAGNNITVYGMTFLNVGYGLNTNAKPDGILMQDCDAPNPSALRSYLAYSQGADQVFLGNTVANVTREHCVRVDGTDRILLAYNNFTNLDRRQSGDPGDLDKQSITVHHGSLAYLYKNTTHSGRVEIGPLGEADGLQPDRIQHRLQWVKIEDNNFNFLKTNHLEIDQGTSHVMIDGNTINTQFTDAITIQAEGKYTDFPGYGTRTVEDATVEGDNDINGASGSGITVGRGDININVLKAGTSLKSAA